MNKTKMLGTIVGILLFVALVAGLSYAWYTWRSSNTTISGSSGCFTIDYVAGIDIGGAGAASIDLSSTYTGGLSTSVQMGIDSSCTVNGTGTLYLTTNSTGTSEILLSEGALKYQVLASGSPVASGTITQTGQQAIYSNFNLSSGRTTYTIYVWVDGNIADNEYVGATYSGYIHASAAQSAS